MDDIIEEIQGCMKSKLYISAVSLALIVPDNCGALQSQNGKTNKDKYVNWFNRYVDESSFIYNFGENAWKLRCSALHQGSYIYQIGEEHYQRIAFVLPVKEGGTIHNIVVNGIYLISSEIFVNEIINAYKKWKKHIKNNSIYKRNIKKSFSYNPNGLYPTIQGVPILG